MLLANRYAVRHAASVVINLAHTTGVSSFCIVLGGTVSTENHAFLTNQGFDSAIFLDHPLLRDYCPEYYIRAVTDLIQVHTPSLIVFPSHPHFYDISSHLAQNFRVPVLHGCDNIKSIREDQLFLERVVNNGTERDTLLVHLDVSPSAIVVLKSDTVHHFNSPKAAEILIHVVQPDLSRQSVKSDAAKIQKISLEKLGLEDAELILAGGGGVGTAEGWLLINKLAALLGAKVAGSRAAVNRGFIKEDQLIGISGKIVSPRLYIAVGISGSNEHLMGMKSSEIIVCINKDASAPIFKYAHLSIIADFYEFLPMLIDELTIRKTKSL